MGECDNAKSAALSEPSVTVTNKETPVLKAEWRVAVHGVVQLSLRFCARTVRGNVQLYGKVMVHCPRAALLEGGGPGLKAACLV